MPALLEAFEERQVIAVGLDELGHDGCRKLAWVSDENEVATAIAQGDDGGWLHRLPGLIHHDRAVALPDGRHRVVERVGRAGGEGGQHDTRVPDDLHADP